MITIPSYLYLFQFTQVSMLYYQIYSSYATNNQTNAINSYIGFICAYLLLADSFLALEK